MNTQASFSIPITGTITLENGNLKIIVNQSETSIALDTRQKSKRLSLERGKTIFDLVLESAQEVVLNNPSNRFTAADLYHIVRDKYPDLKRNSFSAHVIASAPNHSSYKHYPGKRDYLTYIVQGQYSLNTRYMPNVNESSSSIDKLF